MTAKFILGTCIVLAFGATASLAASPSLNGNWKREDGKTKIKIAPCGKNLCAINTWVDDPNSDEAVGDTLILTLKPTSGAEFEGEAYDKKRDKTYSMHLSVQQASLKTEGCVLGGVVCKTTKWSRIK